MSFLNNIGSVLKNPFALGALGGATLAPSTVLSTAGAFSGLIDTGSQWYWNNKNYQAEVDQYQYQRRLQALTFGREDSSIQRRASDLKAAGLSPVLAAGNGASSGAIVHTEAPHGEATTISDKIGMIANLLKMSSDISKTYTDNEFVKLQSSKIPLEKANLEASLLKTAEEIKAINSTIGRNKADTYRAYKDAELVAQKTRQAKFDADTSDYTNTPGDSVVGKIFRDLIGPKSHKQIELEEHEEQQRRALDTIKRRH